jgi:hypothetical protein
MGEAGSGIHGWGPEGCTYRRQWVIPKRPKASDPFDNIGSTFCHELVQKCRQLH